IPDKTPYISRRSSKLYAIRCLHSSVAWLRQMEHCYWHRICSASMVVIGTKLDPILYARRHHDTLELQRTESGAYLSTLCCRECGGGTRCAVWHYLPVHYIYGGWRWGTVG